MVRLTKENMGIHFLDGWVNKFDHTDKILGFLCIGKEWLTGQRFYLIRKMLGMEVGKMKLLSMLEILQRIGREPFLKLED